MLVVHVAGMTGVGKTYLCSQIGGAKCSRVECHDLDDLVRRFGRPSSPAFRAELSRIVNAAGPDGGDKAALVILVGGVSVPKDVVRLDHRIVLTVPETLRGVTYRRMLLRNLDNVIRYKDRIEEIVRSTRTPVDRILPRIYGLAINTRIEYAFDDYSRWIDDTVRDYKKRGYVPMSGPAALKFIRSLQQNLDPKVQGATATIFSKTIRTRPRKGTSAPPRLPRTARARSISGAPPHELAGPGARSPLSPGKAPKCPRR